MKYLWLKEALEKKDTGMNNGAAQASLDEDCFTNKDNFHYYIDFIYGDGYIDRIFKIPERDFNLECVKMDPKSKLTDFISCNKVRRGFIISNKVAEIVQACCLPAYRLYPVTLYYKEQKHEDYHYFFQEALGGEYVDFAHSSFYLGNIVGRDKLADIQIKNLEEYRAKQGQLRVSWQKIRPRHLVFNACFNPQWDLFGLKEVDCFTYISERLVKIFKKNKVTGYRVLAPWEFTMEVPELLQTVE